jgi:hypothetical protein
MILRTLVLIVYIIILVAAFALQSIEPALAVFVLYGLLFWVVASFFIYRQPSMSKPVPGTGGGAARPPDGNPPPPAPGAALPSTGPLVLGFCAFCGRDLAPGSTVCPACGHPVRQF